MSAPVHEFLLFDLSSYPSQDRASDSGYRGQAEVQSLGAAGRRLLDEDMAQALGLLASHRPAAETGQSPPGEYVDLGLGLLAVGHFDQAAEADPIPRPTIDARLPCRGGEPILPPRDSWEEQWPPTDQPTHSRPRHTPLPELSDHGKGLSLSDHLRGWRFVAGVVTAPVRQAVASSWRQYLERVDRDVVNAAAGLRYIIATRVALGIEDRNDLQAEAADTWQAIAHPFGGTEAPPTLRGRLAHATDIWIPQLGGRISELSGAVLELAEQSADTVDALAGPVLNFGFAVVRSVIPATVRQHLDHSTANLRLAAADVFHSIQAELMPVPPEPAESRPYEVELANARHTALRAAHALLEAPADMQGIEWHLLARNVRLAEIRLGRLERRGSTSGYVPPLWRRVTDQARTGLITLVAETTGSASRLLGFDILDQATAEAREWAVQRLLQTPWGQAAMQHRERELEWDSTGSEWQWRLTLLHDAAASIWRTARRRAAPAWNGLAALAGDIFGEEPHVAYAMQLHPRATQQAPAVTYLVNRSMASTPLPAIDLGYDAPNSLIQTARRLTGERHISAPDLTSRVDFRAPQWSQPPAPASSVSAPLLIDRPDAVPIHQRQPTRHRTLGTTALQVASMQRIREV